MKIDSSIDSWANIKPPVRLNQNLITVGQDRRYSSDWRGIQQALDDLPSLGGVVNLPPGIYPIDHPLQLFRPNLHLVGSGQATILYATEYLQKHLICIKASRITLANLQLVGGLVNTGRLGGIHIKAGQCIKLVDLWLSNLDGAAVTVLNSWGIMISGGCYLFCGQGLAITHSERLVIRENLLRGGRQADYIGIHLTETSDFECLYNYLQAGSTSQTGIKIIYTKDRPSNGIIHHNQLTGFHYGLWLTGRNKTLNKIIIQQNRIHPSSSGSSIRLEDLEGVFPRGKPNLNGECDRQINPVAI